MSLFSTVPLLRRGLAATTVLLPIAYTYNQYNTPSPQSNETKSPNPNHTTPFSHFSRFFYNLASAEVAATSSSTLLPKISAETVRKNNAQVPGRPVYVTYGDNVYDITEFISSHPGGEHILLAAGGPLEPYWNIYKQHDADWVRELLDELIIGELVPDEAWEQQQVENSTVGNEGPYSNDPVRHPALIVQSTTPFNAETPAQLLTASQTTPNDLFYVRNHMPVPVVDAKDYRLEVIHTDGSQLMSLSLRDLKTKFKQHTVAATVQCAGNRRNELSAVRPVRGGKWEIGAIGNAEWTGVRLCDVIEYALIHGNKSKTHRSSAIPKHICFQGLDSDPSSGTTYAASIPMDVLRHTPDVLLAYEMNGEVLPVDHGFPIRAIVPGVVGARNVKWLGRVILSEKESDSHWQKQDYRSFSPDVNWNNVDFDAAPSIQEMPVISAICSHEIDEKQKEIVVGGYAWSGGGKGIIRVDVSADGGKTWTGANLKTKDKDEKRNEVYDWTLWTVRIPLPQKQTDQVQLVCKAIDSAYNTQPDSRESIWNLRGLLNNSWHRVHVKP